MKSIKIKLSTKYILNALVFLVATIALSSHIATSKFYDYRKILSQISLVIMLLCTASGFLGREKADESAAKILAKVNNILINTVSIILLGLAFMIAVVEIIIPDMSVMLMAVVAIIMTVKAILFIYYDRRGAQNGNIEDEYKNL